MPKIRQLPYLLTILLHTCCVLFLNPMVITNYRLLSYFVVLWAFDCSLWHLDGLNSKIEACEKSTLQLRFH